MKRLAWIDHSFRRKSRATRDLLASVQARFEVDEFWDGSWCGGPGVRPEIIRAGAYDVIVLFQVACRYDVVAAFGCPNVVLIPMYDAQGDLSWRYFLRYSGLRFVCFCHSLHQRLWRLGLKTRYLQYFPPPPDPPRQSKDDDALVGFFWPRTEALDWRTVRVLVGDTSFAQFFLKNAPDPGERPHLPTGDDVQRLSIHWSSWEDAPSAHLAHIASSNVVFASRRKEGIGMGFLEAMAAGKCVVAPNAPTMSEYIRHGENGLLYDANAPRALDLRVNDVLRLGQAARSSSEIGRVRWLAAVPSFLDELEFGRNPRGLRRSVSAVLSGWDRIRSPRVKPGP